MARRGMAVWAAAAVILGLCIALVVAVPLISSRHQRAQLHAYLARACEPQRVEPPAGTPLWDVARAAEVAEQDASNAEVMDRTWGDLASAWGRLAQTRDLLAMAGDASLPDADRASFKEPAKAVDPEALVAEIRSECARAAGT